ncbi:MAG: type II toxin-antitoxin system RelB/DinJ family antitoxin [Thermodesulfobacteriota bacterium]
MPKKEQLNIRIDSKLKENTRRVLDSLGTDFSGVINMLCKQIVLQKKIPFEITLKHNVETLYAIKDAVNGENLNKYNSVDDLFKKLEIDV